MKINVMRAFRGMDPYCSMGTYLHFTRLVMAPLIFFISCSYEKENVSMPFSYYEPVLSENTNIYYNTVINQQNHDVKYYLFHRKIKGNNLVADKQFHATVIFQEGNQLTVLANLVFDIPHEGAQARVHTAVRITHHTTLEKITAVTHNQFKTSR